MKIKNIIITSTLAAIVFTSCETTVVADSENKNIEAPVVETKNEKIEKSEDKIFIESLANVNITVTQKPKIANINRAFSSDYVFAVKDDNGNPLAGYPLTISYPSAKESQEILYSEIDVNADENGSYTFKPEVPSFSADTTVAAYPTPINNSEEVLNAAIDTRAEADWKVRSDIITKGAVLFIWDYNERGRVERNSYDILSEFRTRGMSMVGNAPINEQSYIGKPISTLYKENYEIIENSYGYLIVGNVKYAKPVEPLDDQYVCSLISEIQAVRMKDGKVLYTNTFKHEATGKNWNACVTKAKEELAKEIVDALVYGL